MRIAAPEILLNCAEADIYNRLLVLDNKHILELGCGTAQKTRDIANSGFNRRITALEVDEVAHRNNLQTPDLPNVEFVLAGAQDIPLGDGSVDIVLMFKSLHHVPVASMADALSEIWRVLKPGGFAYISEPVYAGDFNRILSLFNDEKDVREAAFNAIQKAVDEGLFRLVEEIFFNTPRRFKDYAEFENTVINASHSNYRLDSALHARVRQAFGKHLGEQGAQFLTPTRVDLLQR
ncbi:MAG: class I SAM-dependent methyltransferase [Lysobacterales bacterium]